MIGIVCPVGPVDRWGYQRNLAECVGSFCEFADLVVLVQSHEEAAGLGELAGRYGNLSVLANEQTWFHDGRYRAERVAFNRNLGADALRQVGCSSILHLDCNWYIPESSRAELRKACGEAQGVRWLFRGCQVGKWLFSPGMRLPNLHGPGARMALDDDSAISPDGATVRRESGFWPERGGQMVVDTELEVTWGELEERMNFVRCYADLAVDRSPVFDRRFWQAFYRRKYASRKRSGFELGKVGQAIAARHEAKFVSETIAGELKWNIT